VILPFFAFLAQPLLFLLLIIFNPSFMINLFSLQDFHFFSYDFVKFTNTWSPFILPNFWLDCQQINIELF